MTDETHADGTNRLADASSPYLLQHRDNPVHWWPWCDEAFEEARRRDVPVFLSIGYATCHWCHVMAHESFEDAEVARLMNEAFVNVKVDREERPDVDAVYMNVCQLVTGSGGWPLTIIMTPDKRPFFAGTYIPRTERWGRPGMLQLVPAVAERWRGDRDALLDSAGRVTAALEQVAARGSDGPPPGRSTLDAAYTMLAQRFDEDHGGFGSAPKFPSPHQLSFLLRDWHATANADSLRMVERTLDAMRLGGIHDHVGGGFHRYSTDARWLLPHFEKMLYDQAGLCIAYAEAYHATGHERHGRAARDVVEYVLRDLAHPEGAFCSAEDADSEGEEGTFYVWTLDQLHDALGDEAAFAAGVYGATREGNFDEEATGQRSGRNVLHLRDEPTAIADDLGMGPDEFGERLDAVRGALFEARERRERPLLDDKVLADWNGHAIAALAVAARALDEPGWAEAAEGAADFVLDRMRGDEGRLLHRYRDGDADIVGFLDDHAFMAWGLVELYETTHATHWLDEAVGLADAMIERFWDPADGGFFQTAADAEALLVRNKDRHDGASPSGNGVAADVLQRLSMYTGETVYAHRAEATARACADVLHAQPAAACHMLRAVGLATGTPREVVIAGAPGAADVGPMLDVLHQRFAPNTITLLRAEGDRMLTRLAPWTSGMGPVDGRTAAYVCTDHACERPVTGPDDLAALLSAGT